MYTKKQMVSFIFLIGIITQHGIILADRGHGGGGHYHGGGGDGGHYHGGGDGGGDSFAGGLAGGMVGGMVGGSIAGSANSGDSGAASAAQSQAQMAQMQAQQAQQDLAAQSNQSGDIMGMNPMVFALLAILVFGGIGLVFWKMFA